MSSGRASPRTGPWACRRTWASRRARWPGRGTTCGRAGTTVGGVGRRRGATRARRRACARMCVCGGGQGAHEDRRQLRPRPGDREWRHEPAAGDAEEEASDSEVSSRETLPPAARTTAVRAAVLRRPSPPLFPAPRSTRWRLGRGPPACWPQPRVWPPVSRPRCIGRPLTSRNWKTRTEGLPPHHPLPFLPRPRTRHACRRLAWLGTRDKVLSAPEPGARPRLAYLRPRWPSDIDQGDPSGETTTWVEEWTPDRQASAFALNAGAPSRPHDAETLAHPKAVETPVLARRSPANLIGGGGDPRRPWNINPVSIHLLAHGWPPHDASRGLKAPCVGRGLDPQSSPRYRPRSEPEKKPGAWRRAKVRGARSGHQRKEVQIKRDPYSLGVGDARDRMKVLPFGSLLPTWTGLAQSHRTLRRHYARIFSLEHMGS